MNLIITKEPITEADAEGVAKLLRNAKSNITKAYVYGIPIVIVFERILTARINGDFGTISIPGALLAIVLYFFVVLYKDYVALSDLKAQIAHGTKEVVSFQIVDIPNGRVGYTIRDSQGAVIEMPFKKLNRYKFAKGDYILLSILPISFEILGFEVADSPLLSPRSPIT